MKIRLGDGDPEDVKIYLLTSIVIWNNFAEPSWLGQMLNSSFIWLILYWGSWFLDKLFSRKGAGSMASLIYTLIFFSRDASKLGIHLGEGSFRNNKMRQQEMEIWRRGCWFQGIHWNMHLYFESRSAIPDYFVFLGRSP